ncbi:hypothetical protein [Algiphilus sp.]|uniref:hypothetical protein n=1 Tax=Algiphilus sp. TaxID=1872431 RepID=UPI003BAD6C71
MPVNVYRSTDADAPVLDAQYGSLVALLDAVLVNGYSSGGTAKPGAGWQTAYSAPDKRAYRIDPGIGSGRYLRVDDSEAGQGNGTHAHVRGFDTMSDIDTGSSPFPGLSSDRWWQKSNKSAGDTTAFDWMIVADERTVYLILKSSQFESDGALSFVFGDLKQAGSAHQRSIIVGLSGDDVSYSNEDGLFNNFTQKQEEYSVIPDKGGISQAVSCGFVTQFASTANAKHFRSSSDIEGVNVSGPIYVLKESDSPSSNNFFLGEMPGVVVPASDGGISDGDIIAGMGQNGEDYIAGFIGLWSGGGILLFDITGPWQ